MRLVTFVRDNLLPIGRSRKLHNSFEISNGTPNNSFSGILFDPF